MMGVLSSVAVHLTAVYIDMCFLQRIGLADL